MTNRETAIKAIEAWRANPATTFTPANILREFGDDILAALRAPAPSSNMQAAIDAEMERCGQFGPRRSTSDGALWDLFKDHYWDSFDADKEIVLKHIRSVLDIYKAATPTQSTATSVEGSFQQRVDPWLMECFGLEIARDILERNHRFLEEALELVQANGCTASEAHQLVDYVYGRDQGEINQEVGGVMVTLAALCLASGVDMHEAAETELARVWTKVEKIRSKHFAKPKFSPLPGATPTPSDAMTVDAEELAIWLHNETDHPEHCPGYTWPENEHDDGRREGGFVKIVPKYAQEYFRDIARRMIAGPLSRNEREAPAPQQTIRELYPTAICHECEWEGPRDKLVSAGPIEERCPQCGSEDTEWLPALPGKTRGVPDAEA